MVLISVAGRHGKLLGGDLEHISAAGRATIRLLLQPAARTLLKHPHRTRVTMKVDGSDAHGHALRVPVTMTLH